MSDAITGNVNAAAGSLRTSQLENLGRKAESTQGQRDIAKIRELAKEFESVFMETMISTMRKTIQKSGLIDGGNAEEIYRSMLDSEYAKQMSASGDSGIAANIERYLSQAHFGPNALPQPNIIVGSPEIQGLPGTGKQGKIASDR